jgi:NAD(P)-dependent dehydrogenase (short-subunit alcohol dehydrogenase family)
MPDERIAIVTGASRGIGRGIAQGLARAGYAVVVNYASNADAAREVQEQIQSAGGRAETVRADISVAADREELVAATLRTFGRIDLLVNNAGLMDAEEVPVWQADPDEWWAVVTSHIRGGLLPARAVVPGMVERGSGRVVDLASGLSTRGGRLYSAYSVGKTGLMRLTEVLAAGLDGTGVHVFDLAPGVVRTSMSTSMSLHENRTEWTDPEQVVAFVAAIAAGELDQWSGRFLHAGMDELERLRTTQPDATQRQLRLQPYAEGDPAAG